MWSAESATRAASVPVSRMMREEKSGRAKHCKAAFDKAGVHPKFGITWRGATHHACAACQVVVISVVMVLQRGNALAPLQICRLRRRLRKDGVQCVCSLCTRAPRLFSRALRWKALPAHIALARNALQLRVRPGVSGQANEASENFTHCKRDNERPRTEKRCSTLWPRLTPSQRRANRTE